MAGILDLRAHHVAVLEGVMGYLQMGEQVKLEPDSNDLRAALSDANLFYKKCREIYGDSTWDFIEDLAGRVRKNKDLLFRIGSHPDGICGAGCSLRKFCLSGNQMDVSAAFAKQGISVPSEGDLVECDLVIAKESGLNIGQTYSAKDLFREYLFQ